MDNQRSIVGSFRPSGQHGKTALRASHVSSQQFARGKQMLDRKDKTVVAIPGIVRQQSAPSVEILEGRGVRRRDPGASARDEIQLRNPFTFRNRRDQMSAPVELIDNLEDPFLKFVW